MAELISTLILLMSVIGMLVIVYCKIPSLAQLPELIEGPKKGLWLRLKDKVANISFVKSFSFELFLQKILSRIRILSLKIEYQVSYWLQKLRERSKNKKNLENDRYWEELKNSTFKMKTKIKGQTQTKTLN